MLCEVEPTSSGIIPEGEDATYKKVEIQHAWLVRQVLDSKLPRRHKPGDSAWKYNAVVTRGELRNLFETTGEYRPACLFSEARGGYKALRADERETLLTMVALLAMSAIEKGGGSRLGSPDKPNKSALVDTMLRTAKKHGLAQAAGVNKTTLSEKLSEALERLK